MRLSPRRLVVVLVVAAGIASIEQPIRAQDTKKDAARQKVVAAANMKKADFGTFALVETDHFLVATTLGEEKAKTLGALFDKITPLARKSLQFEEKEEAWKGKLTVYFLLDSRDVKAYIRSVVGMQPGGVYYDVRADEPFLVDPVETTGKTSEADQFAGGAAVVASAYLKAKGGTAALPDWLVSGFGRVTALRAEGLTSRRYLAHKTAARNVTNRGGKPTDLWGETKPANADVLANSFSEYLAFGPGAPNFIKLVVGFRPDDNGNAPGPQQAFEAAGWKDMAMVEAAWRKWAATGK